MIATAKCLVPRYHDSNTPSRTPLGYVSLGTSLAPCCRGTPTRMEAKRRALDEIAARQRAADVKRQQTEQRERQAATAVLVQ